jgi:hypothetical protein
VPTVIENPILNSLFEVPSRHFRFNDEGITDEIAEGRRESGYFLRVGSIRRTMVTIKICEQVATYNDGRWECPDRLLEDMLNLSIPVGSYSPADGPFEVAAAKPAIAFMGSGEIVAVSPSHPLDDPNSVY